MADGDGVSRLTAGEVRRRASAGLFYISSGGAASLVIGFLGNLALARLLAPKDFGVIALGSTVIFLAKTLTDGGLVNGLVRRSEDPTKGEFRTLMGVQLVITLGIAGPAALVATQFGRSGAIAAVMMLSLPVAAFQASPRVVLTRDLLFARIALTDLVALNRLLQLVDCGRRAWYGCVGDGNWRRRPNDYFDSSASCHEPAWLDMALVAKYKAACPDDSIRHSISAVVDHTRSSRTGPNLLTGVILGVAALGVWSLAAR